MQQKNIHIISIGGSVMHDLAINLKNRGNKITGSDDIIYNPSKSRLKKNGLLPKTLGHPKVKVLPLEISQVKENLLEQISNLENLIQK